jgi:hypothetical protein
MKILASLAAASVMALAACVLSYAGQPAGSPLAVPALRTFLAVFIAGVVLSAAAGRLDRRRAAAVAKPILSAGVQGAGKGVLLNRMLDQAARVGPPCRAENERGIAADTARRRSREARIAAIYAAHQAVHGGYRDPNAHFGDYQRLHRAQSAAKRGASRSEVAEAYSRCHPVRGLGNGLGCQL